MAEIGVTLATRMCFAGHLWASPTFCVIPRCPFCAEEERERLVASGRKKTATIAALRGALTKAKARRG